MYGKQLIIISFIVGGTHLFALEDRGPLVLEPMKIPEIIANPTPLYIGLGLTTGALNIGTDKLNFNHNTEEQDRVGALTVLFGYDIHKKIALEGRYTTSLIKETLANIQSISMLLKPHLSLADEMTAYALLGYGQTTLIGVKKQSIDVVESSFQWGFGLEYDSTETLTYFVDYNNFVQNVDNLSADALAIGIKYRF